MIWRKKKEEITFYLLNISLASSLAFQFKWLRKYSYTCVVAGVAYVSKGSTVIIDSLPKRSWSITSYNPIYFKTEVKTVKIPNPRNSGFVRTSPLFRPSLVLLFFVLLLCHYPKSFSSQETSYLWIYIFAHVFNVYAFTSFSPLLSRPPYYSECPSVFIFVDKL